MAVLVNIEHCMVLSKKERVFRYLNSIVVVPHRAGSYLYSGGKLLKQ